MAHYEQLFKNSVEEYSTLPMPFPWDGMPTHTLLSALAPPYKILNTPPSAPVYFCAYYRYLLVYSTSDVGSTSYHLSATLHLPIPSRNMQNIGCRVVSTMYEALVDVLV